MKIKQIHESLISLEGNEKQILREELRDLSFTDTSSPILHRLWSLLI